MKPSDIAEIRQSQQQMLANVDEIEQAYRDRPASIEADPELEKWIAETRQSIADQREWLASVQADIAERQTDRRKQVIGIILLLVVLAGIVLFS